MPSFIPLEHSKISLVFSVLILGFPTVIVSSSVGFPSTLTILGIVSLTPLVISPTHTVIVAVLDLPAGKSTTFHVTVFVVLSYEIESLSYLFTNATCLHSNLSSITSVTVAFPFSAPLLVTVIVYSTNLFSVIYASSAAGVSLVAVIIGFLTSVGGFGSLAGSSFTVTSFAVSIAEVAGTSFPSTIFVSKLSMVTLNLIVNVVFAANK